jgi:hypothetical protein
MTQSAIIAFIDSLALAIKAIRVCIHKCSTHEKRIQELENKVAWIDRRTNEIPYHE